MIIRFLKLILVTALFATPMISAEPVRYGISITNAAQHLAEVSAAFPATEDSQFTVHLPIWRTGRYLVQPLANGIRQFAARGRTGRSLPVRKTDKSTWQIDKDPGEAVTVSYELYANELGSRTRHIDDSHAYLNASAVWVYSPQFRAQPVEIALTVPEGWRSRSGMDSPAGSHAFTAKNYDLLVDSPIETGIHEFAVFSADGRAFELAIWGRGNFQRQMIVEDLKKLVTTTGQVFGGYPFERYLFIVHATGGEKGATEHLNSTVIQLPRWNFAPRKAYLGFIRTATHEFFHTWNVKAYRPSTLAEYDFQKENYSELLWLVEGHTSYFDNLLTLRAGLQTRDEYLEELGNSLDDYLHQPGRFFQSALESSFDEWIKPSGERARNASVDIYSKGEMIALALDLTLRKASGGQVGVEALHQQLWKTRRADQGGYNSADVQAILHRLAPLDWEQFWQDFIAGTKELPLLELLKEAGLELRAESGKDDKALFEAWWGLNVKPGETNEFAIVTGVERDSPAWQAGIVSQDAIVALDQFKVSAKDFADRAAALTNGPVEVTLFRRDQLQTLQITPVLRAKGKRQLKPLASVTAEQKELHRMWLGVDWPK